GYDLDFKSVFDKEPSPPVRGEREGPIAERWEGEVGLSASALESPTSPQPSPPPGAEREQVLRRVLMTVADLARESAAGRVEVRDLVVRYGETAAVDGAGFT